VPVRTLAILAEPNGLWGQMHLGCRNPNPAQFGQGLLLRPSIQVCPHLLQLNEPILSSLFMAIVNSLLPEH
jgi:hypothetical protein